jgi:Lrp/AsnC family transcriptional regulator for asnA, asnC and gidA
VQRLEQADILQIVGIANPLRIGFDLMSLVGIHVRAGTVNAVAEAIAALPEPSYVAVTAGRFDLVCEVICRDTAHFHTFLTDHLTRIDGVERCESFLILDIKKLAYGWGVGRDRAEDG